MSTIGLELTYTDGRRGLVMLDDVSTIDERTNGTEVVLRSGKRLEVTETYEEVKERLTRVRAIGGELR